MSKRERRYCKLCVYRDILMYMSLHTCASMYPLCLIQQQNLLFNQMFPQVIYAASVYKDTVLLLTYDTVMIAHVELLEWSSSVLHVDYFIVYYFIHLNFLPSGLFFILLSLLALFFNFTLPNELRGFLFFAQVRSSYSIKTYFVYLYIGNWFDLQKQSISITNICFCGFI